MDPKTKTGTARVWTYLSAPLRDRLSSFCAASNVTERAVFEAAIEQYISGTSELTLVLRRIERLYRAADRVHEDVELLRRPSRSSFSCGSRTRRASAKSVSPRRARTPKAATSTSRTM
jgi:hypothetical protein